MRKFFRLIPSILLLGMFHTYSGFAKSYEAPQEFMNLYFDFSGNRNPGYPKGKINASKALIDSRKDQVSDKGPLIMVIKSMIYVYDHKGKLLLKLPLRASKSNGFFEMTAISHVGPALAYYLQVKNNGSSEWKNGLKSFLKNLKIVQALNRKKENNWLDNVEALSWGPFKKDIHNMVDYACSFAGNYISGVLKSGKLTENDLVKNFYERSDKEYPISYSHVMISTFMLTALEAVETLKTNFEKLNLDWTKAKILLRLQAGSNISSGLTTETNWLAPTFESLSQNKLPADRMFITPYLEITKDLGQDLSKRSLSYYMDRAWGSTYSRSRVAKSVFNFIPSIYEAGGVELPGNYGATQAHQISHFMMRLKYSLTDERQMLSNTVAFWMAGEYMRKKGVLKDIDVPGLNIGFKKGVSGYPSNNPEIK